MNQNNWLLKRKRKKYNYRKRKTHLFKIFLPLIISVIVIIYSYKNLSELKNIGWVLMVLSLTFIIRNGYFAVKEFNNWYSRQINLVKIISWIIIISLLYFNQELIGTNIYRIYASLQPSSSSSIPFLSYGLVVASIILLLFATFIPTTLKTKIISWIILIILIFLALPFAFENIDSYLEDKDVSEINPVQQYFSSAPERREDSLEGFAYVNELRSDLGKKSIAWDENLYNLALARSKDMNERNYFDHITPDGTCVKDMRGEYNLSKYTIAENIGGQMYDDGSYTDTIDVIEQVDGWMTSRGHRYNLLYTNHVKGAIGCYYGVCVFLGAHTEPYGLGAGECTTGDEGLSFWGTVKKQPGEI